MTDKKTGLRGRAEEKAARFPEDLGTLPPEEVRRMLHELRVHQIELEMQNEDLRAVQEELSASRARYFELYDLAPVGYCTVSEKGLILEANLTVSTLLGAARGALAGQPFHSFLPADQQDIYYLHRKRLFETGAPQACELRMARRDGGQFWARLEASTARDAGGAPVCRVVMTDITGRRLAELESEAAQKSAANNLRLYSFLAQVNLAAAQAKDRARLFSRICEIAVTAGGMKMAWIGLPDKDLGRITPFSRAGFVDGYLDSIKIDPGEASPFAGDPAAVAASSGKICVSADTATDPMTAFRRKKALERGYHSSAAIPLEEGGRFAAVLSIYSEQPGFFAGAELELLNEIKADISLALDAISAEEKRSVAQAALTRTAGQLAHVMEANPVILFTLRRKAPGVVLEWVSGNAEALTGFSPAEILTPGWWEEHLHPQDKDWAIAVHRDLGRKGPVTHDFRLRKKDGSYFWVHSQLKVSSAGDGEITGSWIDITPLKESEMRFQELFDNSPMCFHSLDADGRLLAVNETWVSAFGYDRREAIGKNLGDFLAPEYKKVFAENFPRFKAAGEIKGVEFEILRKDGGRRRLSHTCKAAHNPDGSFRRAYCVCADITDTWKAARQTDLLSQAIKASFNEIYLYDAGTFRFIFINRGAAKNLGYSPEELEKLTPWDLEKEFTEASFRAKAAPLLRGEPGPLIFESAHTRKDGTVYPVEVRLQYIESSSPVFLAVINDITERKKAERMMREMASMQRVESLGAMAGGIAHDFNNMLTGIMANLSLLAAGAGGDAESGEIIRDTLAAARKAQSLTAQLLAFSKGGKPVKREFRLGPALREIFNLATSGTNAACEIEIPENLWSVDGDENQVKQAVNNLLINAMQAMPSGGTLRLMAGNVLLDKTGAAPLPPGDYVRIAVSDTGVGIPAQYLDRIFDPYFTTKSRGHGLGLSMAWSVIKNHGGRIEAASEPGKGAVFEIYLPATGRCLMEAKDRSSGIQKGSGRVLVLEDEEVVRKVVKRILTQLGYTCEITGDGNETVRRYAEEQKAGKPFDIVIMDLTIPGGQGGREAVRELRKIAPEAPVIVSSGYSDEAVMADYKAYGFSAVLPKPYKYEELAETLARLLSKRSQAPFGG